MKLTVPVIVHAYVTGGNVRHVREDGVFPNRLRHEGLWTNERNPTKLTACGLATMEDIDIEADAVEARRGRWCASCQAALENWLVRQELLAVSTTPPTRFI